MDAIERLLAIEAIKQLKGRNFRLLDTKDWAGLSTIFSEDAVFDARAALSLDGPGQSGPSPESAEWIYRGRDAIVAFMRAAIGASLTCHHGHCHEIELLSPTEAQGVIAMEDQIFDASGGAPVLTLHGCGHYHETYRKTQDRWEISSSRLSRLYVAVMPG